MGSLQIRLGQPGANQHWKCNRYCSDFPRIDWKAEWYDTPVFVVIYTL